jgi:hypothetical protein
MLHVQSPSSIFIQSPQQYQAKITGCEVLYYTHFSLFFVSSSLLSKYCPQHFVTFLNGGRKLSFLLLTTGYVASMGEMRNEYNISVGKSEMRRPLRRTRYR